MLSEAFTVNVQRCENTVQQFIDLSKDFSVHVNSALITVQSLELAYQKIELAVSKTHDDVDVDNVVRRRLMHRIARRDMNRVLEQTLRMEKLLAESIKLLIHNVEAALSLTHCIENCEGYNAAEYNLAKNELIAKLDILKDVERGMLNSDRFRQ